MPFKVGKYPGVAAKMRTLADLASSLAFVSAAALVFGLLMLHPYPRQSLFGPTLRGKPWCSFGFLFMA